MNDIRSALNVADAIGIYPVVFWVAERLRCVCEYVKAITASMKC
jgi:hypothetical protein